jgi:hypothetical protein
MRKILYFIQTTQIQLNYIYSQIIKEQNSSQTKPSIIINIY